MSVDLFVSYARKDDRPAASGESGWIMAFVSALQTEHRRYSTVDLSMFVDHDAVQLAEDWDLRIRGSLRASSLMLAFISPSYFASAWCELEWEQYVQQESERALSGEGVLPLYLLSVPGLEAGLVENGSAWSNDLARRQWHDLRASRLQGLVAFDAAPLQRSIELLDQQIALLLERARRALGARGNVDRSNANFVGRRKELRRLRSLLTADTAPGSIVAVHGLGGLGKTTLVTQYAHQFAGEYPGGRWVVRCERQHDLAAALLQLASPLAIEFTDSERRDPERAFGRLMTELERRTFAVGPAPKLGPACLLVLDNVDDPALLAPTQVDRLPKKPWLHLLVTSRLGKDALYAGEADRAFVAIDELPDTDAVLLIEGHQPAQQFASAAERRAARTIVRRLGGFALVVEAVAVFLGLNPDVSCAAFSERLAAEGLDAPESLAADAGVANLMRHREKQLSVVFAPLRAQLSEPEQFVLDAASVLPPDCIALPWLQSWAAARYPQLLAAKPGYAAPWPQLLRRLLGRRLLVATDDAAPDGSPRTARMHRLLQEWNAGRDGFPRAALMADVQNTARTRLEALNTGWSVPAARWELEPLAAAAAQRLAANDPGASAFAVRVVYLLQQSARFAQAEGLLRDALVLEQGASSGTSSPGLALVKGSLGGLLMATARYAEAEPLLRDVLAADEAALGGADPKLATDCNNLAALLMVTARFEEATELYLRALTAYEQAYGPDSIESTATLNNAGQLLQSQNRVDEAEAIMRRAVAIQAKHLAADDPRRAVALLNLGRLLYFTRQIDEAEPLVRHAIALEEAAYGAEHHGLATNLMYLADILVARGQPDAAVPMLQRALPLHEAAYGNDHPETARLCVSLGKVLLDQQDFEAAEGYARRALAINEERHGSDHPNTLQAVRLLMSVLIETERLEEALPLAQSNLKGCLQFTADNGRPHPDLHAAFSTYSGLLRRQGVDEAVLAPHLTEVFAEFGITLSSGETQKPRRAGRKKPVAATKASRKTTRK